MHDVMFEEFVALMRALSHNPQWRAIIIRSRTLTAASREHIYERNPRPSIRVSDRPGYLDVERDIKQILGGLMGEHESAHVDALFENLKAFSHDVKENPVYREFLVDVHEVLEEIADHPEVLDDPAARMALRVMYNSAVKMLNCMVSSI